MSRLDEQDIDDAVAELSDCDNPQISHVRNLIQGVEYVPFHHEAIAELGQNDTRLQHDTLVPRLFGPENIPWDPPRLPNANGIKEALTTEIQGDHQHQIFVFVPARPSHHQDFQAAQDLINNIPNEAYRGPGSILDMHCHFFEKIQNRSGKEELTDEGVLDRSQFGIEVTPSNETLDLRFRDRHTVTTLVTGLRVWICYPPINRNRQAYYDAVKSILAGESRNFLDTLEALHFPIVIIQKPGQTLVLPPFWMVHVCCPKTSVATVYTAATARSLYLRFDYIQFWLAQISLRRNADSEKRFARNYVFALVKPLEIVLDVSRDKKTKAPELNNYIRSVSIESICDDWNSARWKLKKLFEKVGDARFEDLITERVIAIWVPFLLDQRVDGEKCRLCQEQVSLKGWENVRDAWGDHVFENHFLAND